MKEKNLNILTREGKIKLQKEIKQLIEVERPKVIEELSEARSQGDLSENAEFDAAREQQGKVEDRIREIELILENYKIIQTNQATNKVIIGSKVEIKDLRNRNKIKLHIVGTQEANPFDNKISNESPLAEAILGFSKGDEVIVETENKYKVKIINIK